MAHFYITQEGYLVSTGYCADGLEEYQASGGQHVVLGRPPGFNSEAPPYPGARWHVAQCCWVDARSDAERASAAAAAVIEARVREYPPVSEFADAVYWAAQGDNSPMEKWLAACAAVKARNPKLQREETTG
jgi:hypothetical protein